MKTTETMERIAEKVKALIATRPGLALSKWPAEVSIAVPAYCLWIGIEQAERIGFSERIRISEYRARGLTEHYAGSAWEAMTTVVQILDKGAAS
jgi:hypothetical protein